MAERELCGHLMRTGEPCGVRAGHGGQHRSAHSLERRRTSEREGALEVKLPHEHLAEPLPHAWVVSRWDAGRSADPELPASGHARAREHPNGPEQDAWQFGQTRPRRAIGFVGPWVRLRDRIRARAAAEATDEVTLAELLRIDDDDRTTSEGPWVSA